MQRTREQNNALWKFYELLADELNNAGLDMKVVLKPEVSIPWSKDSVHDFLWLPIQKALYKTDSTKDLDKIAQIDEVHRILTRHLGERFGLEVPNFPHDPTKLSNFHAPLENGLVKPIHDYPH